MGKTRLALEAATDILSDAQLDNFERGVFFVSLAPLRSADAIVPTVASAIGFSFYAGDEPRQQLLDYLRQKNMLLIMDNFEHLLDGVDLVSDVLKTAPDVKILATSRARLNVRGEHRFQIVGIECPNWDIPEEDADSANRVEYSAVKLFLQGARRARPGFELEADDFKYVSRICRLVQGMPLGILLAAAWVEMLTLEEIAAEIGQSLDFLETELRDVPERQRSIRAVFDHSWSLLTERQREVLQGLSVFRGGFTRQAAQQVAGASLTELKGLVNRSLIQRAPTGRYDVHKLLRQYAAQKLELSSAASEKVGDHHCAHYISALEQFGLSSTRRLEALAEMNAEIGNARGAWNWATERGQVERLNRAISGLSKYYFMRGRFQECEADCAAAAQRLEGMMSGVAPVLGKAEGLPVLSRVLSVQGSAVFSGGHYEAGQQLVQQSLELLDDPTLVGQDTRAQRAFIVEQINAMVTYSEGKGILTQEQSYEAMLAQYQALGDRWKMIGMLGGVGKNAFWRGDLDAAEQRSKEQLALCQELGDQLRIAGAYFYLANVAQARGELDKSEHLYRKAIHIWREAQNPVDTMWAQRLLGHTLMRAGKFAQARRLLDETLATFGDQGNVASIANLYSELAFVEVHEGDYERARFQGETSLALSRKAPYRWGIAYILPLLSRVAVVEAESGLGAGTMLQVHNNDKAREAYAEAQRLAQEAVTMYRDMDVRLWLGEVLAIQGSVACKLGNVDQVQRYLCEALKVSVDTGTFWPLMLVLPVTALLLVDGGEYERAVELYALASRYPLVANSRWFEDVFGRHIAAIAATLPPEVIAPAQERGRARDMDATVAELLTELEA
jgi:predicted ATPase